MGPIINEGILKSSQIQNSARMVLDRISDEEMRRRKHAEYERFQHEFKSGLNFGR